MSKRERLSGRSMRIFSVPLTSDAGDLTPLAAAAGIRVEPIPI